MSDSQATSLSVGFDAAKATAGAAQFNRAAQDIIGATKGVEAASIRQIESSGRQQRSVDALARRLDPLGQAVRDATRDMDRLTRISQGSGEAASRAATLLAAAQTRVTTAQQAQANSMRTAEGASRSFANQTTQTTSALRQLGMQQSGVIGAFAAGGIFAVGMAAAAAAVTAFTAALKAIPAAGDAALASTARLSATVGDMGRAVEIFEKLQESSRQTGISVADSAAAFQRFSIAAKDLGATNDQVLNLVSGLQKFALVSGSSTSETAAATQQLAQALASGVLQGDELRSILENMPLFAQALAKELGTSIGNLRTMGAEGKLTGEVIFPAMMRAAQGVDDVFAGMPQTMARAQQQFEIAAQSFLTSLDQALGFSQALVSALNTAAALVDKIRGFAGGATSGERTAGLIAEQAAIQKRIAEWNQVLQDARASGLPDSDVQVQAITKGMAAATAELEKNRAELLQINNKAVLQAEAEQEVAAERQLSSQRVSGAKSTAELQKKYDKDFAIKKEYDDNLAKLNRARDVGGVSEEDYLKISAAMLKERDDALQKLTKTEEKYGEGVKKTTDAVRRTTEAVRERTEKTEEAGAALERDIAQTEAATESQRRITAAYDGTQESLDRVQAQEKAHAAALKAGILPGMEQYEATVSQLSDSYLDSTTAAREFQQAQSSVSAIMDTLSNAADRLGQGLVDAFLSGSGAAVNFGNIAKSILASVVTDFLKLGVLNPAINSLVGGGRPTLSAGLSALGGGGKGGALGGIMDIGSNLSTAGGITDALGLTSFSKQLSGIGDYLGLTGSNGAFSGIGNTITDVLNTSLFGATSGIEGATASQIAGATASNGLLSEAAVAGNMGISSSVGSPGLTVGGAISGIGLGYGAGSLAGGLVQSSLGKVGPAPQIGAGGGAIAGAAIGSIVPVIGTVIGGLIGGLVGGAGGGLIGPKAATPFSATALNVGGGGTLEVGGTQAQLVDLTAELSNLQQEVAQLNQVLSGTGSSIVNGTSQDQFGQNRLIGGNSGEWLNIGQGGNRSTSLSGAFSELRFSANDNSLLDQNISNRSFSGVQELANVAQEVTNFTDQVLPALKAFADDSVSFGAGTLATTIDALSKQFNAGIATASKLGFAEFDLIEAREKAIEIANDNARSQLEDARLGLQIRLATARGSNTGDLQMQLDAQLAAFDAQAAAQRTTFANQLKALFGDIYAETQAFAEQMALLEETLGQERLATAKSYLSAIAAQQTQSSTLFNTLLDFQNNIFVRYWVAVGQNTENLQTQLNAAMLAFDVQAQSQRRTYARQLEELFGESFVGTTAYYNQMAALDKTLAEERLAVGKSFHDAMLAQQKEALRESQRIAEEAKAARERAAGNAASIVSSITDYVKGIKFGGESPLPAGDRLAAARADFEQTVAAAQAGNGDAMRNLTAAAETYRSEARSSFGSGAEFVAATSRIVSALETFSGQSADSLTTAVFATETRTQTQVLVAALSELRAELARLRQDMVHAASAPPLSRAA